MSGEAERDVGTIVAERAGVLAFARETCGQIDTLCQRKRLGDADASALKNAIRAFAQGVATGLHRDGRDPAMVRTLMRSIVVEQGTGV